MKPELEKVKQEAEKERRKAWSLWSIIKFLITKLTENNMSKLGSLNPIDWKKILNGLVIALLGALATWLEQDLLKLIDFGSFTMVAVAINSTLVNTIRKILSDSQGKLFGKS